MTTKASTTTGIKKSGVEKIKNAVSDYVRLMERATKDYYGVKEATIKKAIKGSNSVATLKTLNKTIESKMANLFEPLKGYNTDLDTILSNYKSGDANNATFSNVTAKLQK